MEEVVLGECKSEVMRKSGTRGISEGLMVLLAGHLNANREVLKSWLTSGGLGYTFATTTLTTESHHV